MFATLLTGLVALAATVNAHPHKHAFYHHRLARDLVTGTGGVAAPTGYLNSNGTAVGTGTGASAVTMTVQPIPATDVSSDSGSGTVTLTSVKFVFVTAASKQKPVKRDNILVGVPWYIDAKAAVPTTFVAVTTQAAAAAAAPAVDANASAAAAVATTSTSTAAVATASVNSSAKIATSGSKKGLSYNDASLTYAFSGKSISWTYDWASVALGTPLQSAEFVPMLWGAKEFYHWDTDMTKAIANGAKHALSFNEPDHWEQANMSPSVAAANHIKYMNPYAGRVSIGSPGVTNGGAGMGIDWLGQFFDACKGQCKVDFIAFHWYDSASNFAYFQKHVNDVITLARKYGVSKVWLTEFGAFGSDSQVASFMAQALPFLDSTEAVERYAYFMCKSGILTNGNSLSTLGQAYASY